MIQVGDIVTGPVWEEIVEIKNIKRIKEDIYSIEALGLVTHVYYDYVILNKQLSDIKILNENSKHIDDKIEQLQTNMWYWELSVNQKYSMAQNFRNSSLIPLPHQLDAVYSRMLKTPTVRYLLADDPGAGKTIMTGMLIKELKARQSARRILILVPPLVQKQWQTELSEKFDEDFIIVNRTVLNEYHNKNPFVENECIIASIYWASLDEIKNLILEAQFDLVIIDEAHKMAAYSVNSKGNKIRRTKLYKLGESVLRKSTHCLLLTATPHKGDVENFRHLMKLIDPDIFSTIGIKETLKDKTNPFIIRRLKENLKYFDGSPLFPKRTTTTIQFDLPTSELVLYQDITEYVKNYFNRAINRKNNGAAFAIMLLQRRLSSSLEAINQSLVRRYKMLNELLPQELRRNIDKNNFNIDINLGFEFDYDLDLDDLEEWDIKENDLTLDSKDYQNHYEIISELNEIERILEIISVNMDKNIERKYEELSNILFTKEGLISKGEKVLIFTESIDTLNFLASKLENKDLKIAKIFGDFSMEERLRQVDLFKGESQVLIATDAGGESINLQFCNNMINYDIPWNPNKLEQRMGRIHRIGQRNNVNVYNLVARNTREGDVLINLLCKMEQMRNDLGSDLVYDFIGNRLDDQNYSLSKIMQNAVINPEHIDNIKINLDQMMNEEYKELIKITEEERIAIDPVDISGNKKNIHQYTLQKVPNRILTLFTTKILEENRVKIKQYPKEVFRIEKITDNLVEEARKSKINIKKEDLEFRYTGFENLTNDKTLLMNNNHPLFLLALNKKKNELFMSPSTTFEIELDVPEKLKVESFEITLKNGLSNEVYKDIVYFGIRSDNHIIEIDPYSIFSKSFINIQKSDAEFNINLEEKALLKLLDQREKLEIEVESQMNKKIQFIRRSFNYQYEETTRKLEQFMNENQLTNKNSRIGQYKSELIDIEERRKLRIEEIEREKNINILPPKKLYSFILQPIKKESYRLINSDYIDIVRMYELVKGRELINIRPSLGIIDFISSDKNGNNRYIILTKQINIKLASEHLADLGTLKEHTFVYIIQNGIISELPLGIINKEKN